VRTVLLVVLVAAGLCLASPAALGDIARPPPPPPPPPPGESLTDPLLLAAAASGILGLILLLLWVLSPARVARRPARQGEAPVAP
jgi:hypothetical protein